MYEAGYALALGLFDSDTGEWTEGCSVNSSAVAIRRVGIHAAMEAHMPAAQADNAASSAAGLDASGLVNHIATASSSLQNSSGIATAVVPPNASQIASLETPIHLTPPPTPAPDYKVMSIIDNSTSLQLTLQRSGVQVPLPQELHSCKQRVCVC